MRKYSSAKNLLEQRRKQKKREKPLNKKFPGKLKIQERSNLFDELSNVLSEHDEKSRLSNIEYNINPLISPWEVVTIFTYPYLSTGAPAQGEDKGLINYSLILGE